MLNAGPDMPEAEIGGQDISDAPYGGMQDIRLASAFLSNGGGATPVNANGASWNVDMVTTTGNVVMDLLHNFHLECGARIHKLRVYETMTEPTGREVCGYLLVRGSVHAHAYALALKKITGVAIEKMLPTPNIDLARIPECQKYLDEGSHRRLYRFSPDDYREMAGIWSNDEVALPGDPPGELEVVDGHPEGGRIHELMGDARAFSPEYAPGGDVRDRDQAVPEVALSAADAGRRLGGRRRGSGRPCSRWHHRRSARMLGWRRPPCAGSWSTWAAARTTFRRPDRNRCSLDQGR